MKKSIKILLLLIYAVVMNPLFAQKIDDFSDKEREFFSSTDGAQSGSTAGSEEAADTSFPLDEEISEAPEDNTEFDISDADVEADFDTPDVDFETFDDEAVVENELEDSEIETEIVTEEVEISDNNNFEINEDSSFDEFDEATEPEFEIPEEELIVEQAPDPVPAPEVSPETPQELAQDYETYNASNDEVDISLSDMFEDEPLTDPSESFNNAGSSQSIGAISDDDFFESSPSPVVSSNRNYDNPNSTYEDRLHRYYKNLAPVDAGEWAQLAGERETYLVQRGDTLWGLSNTFFGDPHFWTKIWSVNSDITNPHLIYPGQNINFILGDSNGVPLFTAGNSDSDSNSESSIISKMKKKKNPLHVKPAGIPDSFPVWNDSFTSSFSTFKGRAREFETRGSGAMSDLHSYISQKNPDDIGSIIKIEQGAKMASVFQYIFIGVKAGTVSVNDRLLVIRNEGRLKAPKGLNIKSYRFRSAGQVKVVKQVYPKSKKIDSSLEYFRAIVEKANSPIELSSYVVKKDLPRYSLEDSGLTGTAKGRLIGAEYNRSRKLYGLNSLVFINGGTSSGFSVNQTYPVYSQGLAKYKSFDTPTARVKIVDVEENVATAVVLDAKEGISTGDYVGVQ